MQKDFGREESVMRLRFGEQSDARVITAMTEQLKRVYGVSSRAAALRRGVAIASVLARHADEQGSIHLLDKASPEPRRSSSH